jgi:KDO2-lipid IV(A) lauroyltransferase
MKKIIQASLFYSLYPVMFAFSILPSRVLFTISDFSFYILYYLVKYRREVVSTNLKNSFPEKSADELKIIEMKSYRHFLDIIFEVLKMFTMSPSQKLSRCKIDPEAIKLLDDLYLKGKSVILVMGHYGNWEYYPFRIPSPNTLQPYAIYHPISNPYINKALASMRTLTGCKLYTMAESIKGMLTNRKEQSLTLFLADQAPSPNGAFWMQFMNQDTPVFNGAEKIAQKLGMAVIYGHTEKTERGKYIFYCELICDDATKTLPGEITTTHVRLLEKNIRKAPEFWLWTHRRWKHKRILI